MSQKVINKVQTPSLPGRSYFQVVNELSSLGLNASTLQLLVSASDGGSPQAEHADKPAHLQYEFEGIIRVFSGLTCASIGTTQHFKPKILLTVDDDLAVSADLSPETKRVIEELMSHRTLEHTQASNKIVEIIEQSSDQRAVPEASDSAVDDFGIAQNEETIFETDEDIANSERERDLLRASRNRTGSDADDNVFDLDQHQPRTIEITLHADSEFFNLLKNELSSIDSLQARQKENLTSQVKDLGKAVSTVIRPQSSGSSSDLYAWREIFLLYRDAAVFFASTERDHGVRTAAQAKERTEKFENQIVARNLVKFPGLSRLI